MNIKEIKNLIKFVSLSNISEVKLKLREFKITIKTDNKKECEQRLINSMYKVEKSNLHYTTNEKDQRISIIFLM